MRSLNDIVAAIAFSIAELIARIRPIDDGGGLLATDWHSLYGRMAHKMHICSSLSPEMSPGRSSCTSWSSLTNSLNASHKVGFWPLLIIIINVVSNDNVFHISHNRISVSTV